MSKEICDQCHHFSDQNAPNFAQGEGRCLGYGDLNPEPLVAWDHRATVLFGPIKDRVRKDKRLAWLARMKEAANAAPAASAGPPRHETQ
jgi:hypothetical protein